MSLLLCHTCPNSTNLLIFAPLPWLRLSSPSPDQFLLLSDTLLIDYWDWTKFYWKPFFILILCSWQQGRKLQVQRKTKTMPHLVKTRVINKTRLHSSTFKSCTTYFCDRKSTYSRVALAYFLCQFRLCTRSAIQRCADCQTGKVRNGI